MDLAEETYDDDVEKIACSCGKILEPIKPLVPDEHVFIYVDDSNMWIEGKKLAAKNADLKCVEDPRLRLDIGKVTDAVANGREVAWGILYGSEPPPIDTVWEKIRESGWKVKTSKRSSFTNKEKQVDHQMVADITTLVSDRGVAKGKIVLVSGDADVIPAVKEGLRKKWSFEVWTWNSGTSKALTKLAKDNPELLTIHPLDSHLDDISFTNFKFSEKQISSRLNNRSAVIKNFCPAGDWQKRMSKKLGWPLQFCWIGPERLDNPKDYKDVLLIFNQVKPKDGKDFECHFVEILEHLQKEFPAKVVILPAYRKEFDDRKEEICITNKYGVLVEVDEELSMSSASDHSDLESEIERKKAYVDTPVHEGKTWDHLGRNTRCTERDDVSDDETAARGHLGRDECSTEKGDRSTGNEAFQVVQRKQRKKTQKYSQQCEHRSKCTNGLKCTHGHTDDEKKFFRNPCKDKECYYKKNCKNGPRCRFAHSNKDSFCSECHQWGHLKDTCTKQLS